MSRQLQHSVFDSLWKSNCTITEFRVVGYFCWRHRSAVGRVRPCSPVGTVRTEGGKSGSNDGMGI